ncbi:hypothetical protein [Alcanivorax sp.]|uniref:hypothetical protein n=1 Tax=Alcanivorax sp. TaxID=1872427 RepID=UPI000C4FF4F9|nr:hypothetical protein [Alcanivorax sp.]MBQ26346.1 hypothetical protein [Alcanivorax sp.]|tara:strand:- start:4169 stop:4495 length:327 start_codon:yes stop_codon:yes gene_type:complete
MQLLNGLITGAMFAASAYLVITLNGIANTAGEKGKKLLKNALLFLVIIPMVAGFLKGVLGLGNETASGLYIGYFAYISGISGVFFLAKGLRQAILEASMPKNVETEEA